jgi:tetratricopeptide (TPR) repeat protein
MSPEEVEAFETRLQDDPVFAQEFDLHKNIHTVFADNERVRAFRTMTEEIAAGTNSKPLIRRLNFRSALSIAASVLVLIFAGTYYFLNTPLSADKIYASYLDQPNLAFISGVERDDQTNEDLAELDRVLQQVNTFYLEKRFPEAIILLDQVTIDSIPGFDNEIHFRLGILHLFNEDPTTAIPFLDLTTDRQEAIRWYKSLALIKLNRLDEARDLLIPLTEFDNPKKKEAEKILKKISKLDSGHK